MLHEHKSNLVEHGAMISIVGLRVSDLPVAPRSGAELRIARERLGWDLADVAGRLRIRLCHLEALEKGHITALPGNAYALGFLRSYANSLGLDAEEVIRRFKSEAAAMACKTDLVFPMPVPKKGLPTGAVVLLGVLLSVGAYAEWYQLSGEGRLPAETVIEIPTRLAPLAEGAAVILQPAVGIETPTVTVSAQQRVSPAPAPSVPPISPTSAAAAAVHHLNEEPPPPVVATPAPQGGSRIILRASSDAWIQVKGRNGAIFLNRILKAGEAWPVPQQDDLLLTTGNAGGTTILIDGVTTPGLGGAGVVRRDIPLDADDIKDGKLVANMTAQLAAGRGHQ